MFLNLLMLAGVGGAAVPLVLHLLSRARYRTVDWGAMMFLEGVNSRQHQSTRLRQILLLLLRMAIVALLAVAMARPVIRNAAGFGGLPGAEGRMTAAIVLDRSASMGYVETVGGKPRLDAAREAVLQILSTLRRGDRVILVLAGDGRRPRAEEPTSDLPAVAARIADLKPAFAAADLADAMAEAMDALERHEPSPNRQLVLVTDRQASGWKRVTREFAEAWSRRATPDGRRPRFHVVAVGTSASDNLAIESIALTNPPAIAGSPAEVEVTVRNTGPAARSDLSLSVRSGQRLLHETRLDVPAGAASQVKFTAAFHSTGSEVLAAALLPTPGASAGAGMTSDDQLPSILQVAEPVRVLVVSGDELRPPGQAFQLGGSDAFRGESDFFRIALAPFATLGRDGTDPATVEVKAVGDFLESDLASQYDVIVLANVADLAPAQVSAIEQFVHAGGGLLVAPGNLVRPEGYNRALHRNGAGVLPAAMQAPVSADGSQSATLLGLDLTHPVFRFLRGRPDPVPSATFARYFPSAMRRGGAARVIASFSSGQPFLIESPYGRGRVLMLTTALDADWSTLPLSNFYLPFMQSAVRYLALAGVGERNLDPGQELRATFDEMLEQRQVAIARPDGTVETVSASLLGSGRSEVRFAGTDLPGTYAVRAKVAGGEERTQQFVVRPGKDESDLTPLSQARWDELSHALGFTLINAEATSVATAMAERRADRELWATLLSAVFALLLIELAVARRWSSGNVNARPASSPQSASAGEAAW